MLAAQEFVANCGGSRSDRRRRSAVSPGRTGSRDCAGRRGWWRSDVGVASEMAPAAASRESDRARRRFCRWATARATRSWVAGGSASLHPHETGSDLDDAGVAVRVSFVHRYPRELADGRQAGWSTSTGTLRKTGVSDTPIGACVPNCWLAGERRPIVIAKDLSPDWDGCPYAARRISLSRWRVLIAFQDRRYLAAVGRMYCPTRSKRQRA